MGSANGPDSDSSPRLAGESSERLVEQTLSRVVTRVTGFDDTSDEGDDAPGAAGSR